MNFIVYWSVLFQGITTRLANSSHYTVLELSGSPVTGGPSTLSIWIFALASYVEGVKTKEADISWDVDLGTSEGMSCRISFVYLVSHLNNLLIHFRVEEFACLSMFAWPADLFEVKDCCGSSEIVFTGNLHLCSGARIPRRSRCLFYWVQPWQLIWPTDSYSNANCIYQQWHYLYWSFVLKRLQSFCMLYYVLQCVT